MTFVRRSNRAFTLIELLVVMGILVVLAVLTGIGVSQISREARLSSGVNQVIAALGSARSYAIQNNTTVLLAFTVSVDPAAVSQGEVVEMVLAEGTGEIYSITGNTNDKRFEERYLPIAGLAFAQLPRGIKVAGPTVTAWNPDDATDGAGDGDNFWYTQPGGSWTLEQGRYATKEPGRMIGVLFSPDGTLVTRRIDSAGGSGATIWPFLDLDRSGKVNLGSCDEDDCRDNWNYRGSYQYVVYSGIGDEVDLHPVQWLAVFDDEALRRAKSPASWIPTGTPGGNSVTAFDGRRIDDVTAWVETAGVPVYFNRYTGVAEINKP